MKFRRPAVAGQFYPGGPNRLSKELELLIDPNVQKQKAIGVISPHAGYMYSGQVAGIVFSSVKIPKRVIILGPNHTGYGPEVSIMDEGIWDMPLGNVKIDQKLANDILQNSDLIKADTLAQSMEHSLEVQVPFLQYLQPMLEIVPIVLAGSDYSVCESVANAIVSGIKSQNEDILIVASTDLTHYQPQSIANQIDLKVIEKIKEMDAKGLHEMVVQEKITMCGFMPTTTMILAAKAMNATRASLVKYMTSGDVTGDFSYVVGYVGMIVN